ncbi:unnamed protein product, partial [Meganyctiphanes norvegica]
GDNLCEPMYGHCQMTNDKCLGTRFGFFNQSLSTKYCGTDTLSACCAPSGQVFTVDIENSLAFALNNTVLYHAIGGGTCRYLVNYTKEPLARKALINFLGNATNYLKSPEHIQPHTYAFIEDVYTKMKDLNFTAEEFQNQLNDTQNTAGQNMFLSYWQTSVGCQTIEMAECYGKVWLYTCGMWKIFHTLTVSAVDATNPLEVVEAISNYAIHFTDCDDCRCHFIEMHNKTILTAPYLVNTTDKAILWVWCAHNAVNNHSKKANPPHPQFPPNTTCPHCWEGEHDSLAFPGEYTNCEELFCPPENNDNCFTTPTYPINFSMKAILSYLKSTYGGPYSYLKTNDKWMPFVWEDKWDHNCPRYKNATCSPTPSVTKCNQTSTV